MRNWQEHTLRDLVGAPISGSRPRGGVDEETIGVPSLGGENILSDGGVTYKVLKRIPSRFFQLMPKGHLVKFDVLINKDGAQTGKVGIYDGAFEEAAVNEHLFILRSANDAIDQRLLYFYLLLPETQAAIARRITGSAQPGLNSQFVDAVRLTVSRNPCEQNRIAKILSTVDEAIKQTEALIVKTQQIKAGLMHDLFTRGVTADGQLKPAARSSRTEFGLLPEGWTAGTLLDVADEKRQPILTGPFGADLGTDDFVDDGVPVLRIGNVQAGYLDLADLLFVTPIKAQELARYVIRSGDLLFARQGATTGRNALANDDADGCLINYHIIRVALDHDKCAPLFIEAAFNGDMVKRQVERDKGRGTREGINTAQLKALRVPLAPVYEQRTIAEVLAAQNEDVQALILERDKLWKLKQGLMRDLLTGAVSVAVGYESEKKEVAANV